MTRPSTGALLALTVKLEDRLAVVAARSITDLEIALIKRMSLRGMKNKDIQFHFNRPDRAVNTGRISGISSGTYSNSSQIAAASDADLDRFLSSASDEAEPRQRNIDPNLDCQPMFESIEGGLWQLIDGESDTRECKAAFGMRHSHLWVKAIAALSNNRGGHIFFGVSDNAYIGEDGSPLPHVVLGMSSAEFERIDIVEITNRLKAYLDPTPRISKTTISFGALKVGVIYVEQHPSRPVIATRADADRIKEGDIFYRYPGQSSRIKYSDLRAVLDTRDATTRAAILPLVQRLLELGPDRALLADMQRGVLDDGRNLISISPDLIEQISFIREGSFDEVEGAPAFKLVGDVLVGDDAQVIRSRGAITDDKLLENFLNQEVLSHPKEYLRYAAGAGHAAWLPLRYFAIAARLNRQQAIDVINEAQGTASRKTTLTAMLRNDQAARMNYVGTPRTFLARLNSGDLPEVTRQDAAAIAQAICGITDLSVNTPEQLLQLLKKCRMELRERGQMSYVRRAACRVDELMHRLTD